MRCVIVFCVLVLLVNCSFGKEDGVYELKGGDLFDLIRGIPPKDGKLKVSKVVEDTGEKHPDGIFFIPEDSLSEVPDELQVKQVSFNWSNKSIGALNFVYANDFYLSFEMNRLSTLVCGELTEEDHVVLVAPVLAPPKAARARVTETAKDFPVLMLLSTNDTQPNIEEPKVEGEPHPIYVQKLEDQKPMHRRRRRFLIQKARKY
ncbi:unnamed protein product [Diatraea saccharalis]|uniref:Lipoprotein n=1 Tax=Diatraea saccharalis TaxID=40085 RepID=A0A9N9RH67_9NEOP|nr:unnamed protein product [Diatraea saccharalis]